MAWYNCQEKCDRCGKFVSIGGAGVSWRQTWQNDMFGHPELNDPVYRCSKCTDTHGIGYSNCNNPDNYRGRNPKESHDHDQ